MEPLYHHCDPHSWSTSFSGWRCSCPQGGGAIGPLYLKPRTLHPDPFRAGKHLLVLCDTHTPPVVRDDGAIGAAAPHASNNRAPAAAALHAAACADPVFSVEQQYVLLDPTTRLPPGESLRRLRLQ